MTSDGKFTEGVCDDGAVILRDGRPVSITEVLDLLNQRDKAVATERERCEAALSAWRIAGAAVSAHGVCAPEDLRKDFTPDRLREAIGQIGIRANAWEDSARVNKARADEAEAKLARLIGRLREPDEAMIEALHSTLNQVDWTSQTVGRALAATLADREEGE